MIGALSMSSGAWWASLVVLTAAVAAFVYVWRH